MRITEISRTLSKGMVSLVIAAGVVFFLSGMTLAATYTVTLAGDDASDDPVYTTPIEVTIEQDGVTEDTADAIINKFILTSKSDFYGKERVLQCKIIARNPKVYVSEPEPPPPGPGPPPPPPPDRVIWWYEPEPEVEEIMATIWRIPVINVYADGVPLAYHPGEGAITFQMPYEGSDEEILAEASLRGTMYAENPFILYHELKMQGMSEEEAYDAVTAVCNDQQGIYDYLVGEGVDSAVAAGIALDSTATAMDILLGGQSEDGTNGTYYQTSDADKFFIAYGNDPETGSLTFKIATGENLTWSLGGEVYSFDAPETEQLFKTRLGAEKSEVGKEKELASIDDVRRVDYGMFHQAIQDPFVRTPGEYTADPGIASSISNSFSPVAQTSTVFTPSPYVRTTNSSLIDRSGLARNQQVANPNQYLYNPPPVPVPPSPVLRRTTPSYRLATNRIDTRYIISSYEPPGKYVQPW